MSIPPCKSRRSCSPWTLAGCGCGLPAMIGILIVFGLLLMRDARGRKDPRWDAEAYAACQIRLRHVSAALASYERDHGKLPPRLEDLVPNYLDRQHLQCPLQLNGLGAPYAYHADAGATDPVITCTAHGQGELALLHNGQLRIPKERW